MRKQYLGAPNFPYLVEKGKTEEIRFDRHLLKTRAFVLTEA